jgi:branched-chain amino acid transport system substrate-binding protein
MNVLSVGAALPLVVAALCGGSMSAQAAEPLRIGLVLPMSGPFASAGKQIEHGARLYLSANGDSIAGRQVELLVRDDGPGTSGDVSKRLAQELVINDKVDVLAGFVLTPAAFAVAPVATQGKKPMVIMNAATSAIPAASPYIVRTSFTTPQVTAPLASWAAKNGIKSVYTLVADFGPGHDAEVQFKKTYTAAGGQVIGELRVPVVNPDFAPYLQRIRDANPQAMFVFLPAGGGTISFMRAFVERGLAAAGIKVIATGDVVDEENLDALGDSALGTVTAFHYSQAHKSPENAVYTDAYARAFPKDRPNFMSVAGFDGMRLIAEALKKTGGNAEVDAFMAAARGLRWVGPRGEVMIDPETRDIIQAV